VSRAVSEVPLEEGTLVIGDLHLDVEDEHAVAAFVAWCERSAAAPRIVILGDFFEYWVGAAQLGVAARVLDALRGLTSRGVAIDVIPGNRDFLLDDAFESSSGARVHPGGLVGRLMAGDAEAARVLFIHGDELCTLDRPYQRLRRVLRSRPVRFVAPRLPAPLARAAARRLRGASRKATGAKPRAEMELQPDAALRAARERRCGTVVCGHAHRFRDDALPGGVRWLVVDAFGGARDTLEVAAGGALAPRRRATAP
jgi:UDP-2,3-diacylglucosamine hydrolase